MKRGIYRSMKIPLLILIVFLLNHTSHASEGFYTIQTGTYTHYALEYAGKQFNFLSQKLNEDERDYLRIELGSKYYIVRLGRFEEIAAAKKVLETVKTLISDAFILKETDFENAKILILHENDEKPSPSEILVSEKKQVPVEDVSVSNEPVKPHPNIEEELVDDFIDDISAHFYNQEYGKAAELIRKGLAKWPDDPDLHALYGATLLDTGFPDKAYEQYRKAVELLPDVPEFHAGVGYSLLDIYLDKAKHSISAFKKALKIDPDNVSALEGLGIVYVSIDRKYLATEIYYRLKELDQDAAARLNEFIKWGLDWGDIE